MWNMGQKKFLSDHPASENLSLKKGVSHTSWLMLGKKLNFYPDFSNSPDFIWILDYLYSTLILKKRVRHFYMCVTVGVWCWHLRCSSFKGIAMSCTDQYEILARRWCQAGVSIFFFSCPECHASFKQQVQWCYKDWILYYSDCSDFNIQLILPFHWPRYSSASTVNCTSIFFMVFFCLLKWHTGTGTASLGRPPHNIMCHFASDPSKNISKIVKTPWKYACIPRRLKIFEKHFGKLFLIFLCFSSLSSEYQLPFHVALNSSFICHFRWTQILCYKK